MNTETETKRVYTKAEEALIERHRDINVHYDGWWEGVYEQVQEELKECGFNPGKMYFSGFWSQGDGACFEGGMGDWAKFCEKVPAFVEGFPFLSEFAKDQNPTYSVIHLGHYYHENCTSHEYVSDLENDLDNMDPESDDAEIQMRYALWKKALGEEGSVLEWLTEHFKDKMRDLYRRLEKEYDYLTSDDVVWESIEANELDRQETLDEEEEDAETADAF